MKRNFLILATLLTFSGLSIQASAEGTMTEPLYTKSAQIYKSYVFDAYYESYKDRQFEEIEEIDATELRVEFTMPIFSSGQIRFSLPFDTDGEGYKVDNGAATDLEGHGGTFNFASIAYEHQFMNAANDNMDLLGYASAGYRADELETTHGDYMNHRGKNFKAGVRINKEINPSMLLLSDVGFQYYWDADDLNPARDGDNFGNLVASVAIIKHDGNLKPALELTYRGDLSDYNNLMLVPELIYSFEAVDVKLGIPVGLSDEADDYGVTAGFTYKM